MMNKAEPLKDKIHNPIYAYKDKRNYRRKSFHFEDVRSAVEWLKNKIKKKDYFDWSSDNDNPDYIDTTETAKEILEIIKEAFPDLFSQKGNMVKGKSWSALKIKKYIEQEGGDD